MSIATELTLLANSKQAIKNSINQKGGSITDSTPFADYSTAIDNLPSGGSGNEVIKSIDAASATPSYMGSSSIQYLTYFIEEIHWPATLSFPLNFAIFYGNNQLPFLKKITVDVNNSDYDSRDNCNAVIRTSYNELLLGCRDTIIPNTVTSIGRNAFRYNRLLSVLPTIPSSVTEIGSGAFESCTALTSAVLPNSITQLPQSIFTGCSSLLSVTIGNQVTSIGNSAFKNCTALTSINIPNTVTSISESAFQNCTSLTFVVVNATTPPTLGSNVFNNTNNCPIYVPAASVDAYKAASGWVEYASRIFAITQLATVDGNPVYNYDLGNTDSTTILSTEIVKMPTGTSIEFAEGVVQIGGQLGAYEDVTLPSTFAGFIDTQPINAATTTLTSKATTPPTAERDNFGGAGLTAIYVPASAVDTYKAASGWSNFASIIEAIPVPTAMKWTSADGTQEISIACEDLIEAGTFTEEDRDNADLDVQIADVEGSAEIGDCVTIIGSQAFSDCSSLSSVTIPDSVTTITLSAFQNCTSLTNVTIPDSVTTIGDFVFQGCSSLTRVTIPDSVTSIGSGIFQGCSSLTSVTVNATTPPTLGRNAFNDTNNCPIYVPAESVEAYKAASGWSTYADRIQAIPNE